MSVSEHLPVLQVVLPLLAAPACVLLRRPVLVRWFASAVAWSTFAERAGDSALHGDGND